MQRFKSFALGTAPVLCAAAFVAVAQPASADYPGELWSVESVQIRTGQSAAGLTPGLRSGLRQANEVYFFGERPVRMIVGSADETGASVKIAIEDITTGALLARSPAIDAGGGADMIRHSALAWMEGLTCGGSGCAGAPEATVEVRVAAVAPTTTKPVSTVIAIAKTDEDLAVSKSLVQPATVDEGALVVAGIPVPTSRPGTTDADPVRKARERIDGVSLVAVNWPATARALQMALPAARGAGALTYSDADKLVTDRPGTLALAAPATSPAPAQPVKPVAPAARPETQEAPTLIGRWWNRVTTFFGFSSGTEQNVAQEPTPVAATAPRTATADATPAPTITASLTPRQPVSTTSLSSENTQGSWTRVRETPVLVNPIDRVGGAGNLSSRDSRLAASDAQSALSNPRVLSDASGIAASSDSLTRPVPRTGASRTATPGRRVASLSVRLHPELFGRYRVTRVPSQTAQRVVTQEEPAPTGTVARSEPSTESLNEVLASRGLRLDEATLSRFENIYWGGTETEGFWISLPTQVPAEYVLVSGPTSSVISSVRRRSGIPRASQGVANALGLKPKQWARLRIIALRSSELSANYSLPFLFGVRKGKSGVH
ncbi:MAG: hypothetical protein AAGD13_04375 [Pseudomonadota bacterium]